VGFLLFLFAFTLKQSKAQPFFNFLINLLNGKKGLLSFNSNNSFLSSTRSKNKKKSLSSFYFDVSINTHFLFFFSIYSFTHVGLSYGTKLQLAINFLMYCNCGFLVNLLNYG
jgi:hypothetical protein